MINYVMSSLAGRNVLVTRTIEQNASLIDLFKSRGAVPVACPTIATEPAEDASAVVRSLADGPGYDWIVFTSTNGVSFFFDVAESADIHVPGDGLVKIAAIGPATAAALQARGYTVDLMPVSHVAESLAEVMGEVDGRRILIPTTDIARDTLAAGLEAAGAVVEVITVYRTVPAKRPEDLFGMLAVADAVTFTSSSTALNFVGMLEGQTMPDLIVACIGSKTAETVLGLGLPVHAVAEVSTAEGLVNALEAYFAPK
jgi:uroporphyrinogen-III synthase